MSVSIDGKRRIVNAAGAPQIAGKTAGTADLERKDPLDTPPT
ncbi:hypothetical protein [Halorubrum vacuolatum]|nr:hypothetical protein [Halorubrum vacuolatum]